jgi:hypothetical protein
MDTHARDDYMDAAEVAAYWKVHVSTVRRWSGGDKPLLTKHRIGRRKIRFARADVEALMVEAGAPRGN